jgi:hypothetical protein
MGALGIFVSSRFGSSHFSEQHIVSDCGRRQEARGDLRGI